MLLIGSIFATFGSHQYNGSTKAAVVLAGGIIKAQNVVIDKKYKRKDCPICKGKGYYISGDGISKVNCGYCEPDSKTIPDSKVVIHSPITLQQNCLSGTCQQPKR
jgi:hypothetical protein